MYQNNGRNNSNLPPLYHRHTNLANIINQPINYYHNNPYYDTGLNN